ncbi:K+ transporter [Sinorhizobium medicae]
MADSLDHGPAQANNLPQFLALTVGAIGVVYGDIGTSPLYAFAKRCARLDQVASPSEFTPRLDR